MKTGRTMRLCGVIVATALAGSVCVADPHHGGGRYDGGRSYHGHGDDGRHHGYYRNSRGELVFGLLGIGVAAAVIASMSRPEPVVVQQPVYVEPPPQVVYVQQPQVIQQPVVVQQPVTATILVRNSNGTATPVTLRQVGAYWVGPRGEYYDGFPTTRDLYPLYGY